MARAAASYVCQDCGASHRKWSGQCPSCGAWNAIVEEISETTPRGLGAAKGHAVATTALDGATQAIDRRTTGVGEFDRVTGGGLVPGAALLIGGDPGIGKSTLVLQIAAALATHGVGCLYVSGEEAVDQIRLRAERLGLTAAPVRLAAATNVRDILATLESTDAPDIAVIDSIQTMYVDTLESAPGTVSQVRASAQELIRLCKRRGVTLFLVGHVTKEGQIAGPRVLEHMVDTVLYFEGDRGHQFRILRSVKNRFGPSDEIGVFEMTDRGLIGVANPSELFLAARAGGSGDAGGSGNTDRGNDTVSGTSVFAGIEGTRPLLVEIQALVAPSPFATPRRTVVGWDGGRLAMVLAVLEARCGLSLAGQDVYLNVAGGLRIQEPAADLAVAAAIVSSRFDAPLPMDAVVFGEIGLSGEVRPVGRADARLKEAAKLGFQQAIMPKARRRSALDTAGLDCTELDRLADLIPLIEGAAADQAGPPRVAGSQA